MSYIFGFIQADGNLLEFERGRGRLSIELSFKDKELLEKIKENIPVNSTLSERIRDTNFKKEYKSCSLKIYNKKARDTFKMFGVPIGKKSNIIEPPKFEHNEIDYWRGIIDADGSIGISSNNIPFITLSTKSEGLYKGFKKFLKRHLNHTIKINRNKRDGVYNIMISRKKAIKLMKLLYYENCFGLNRKIKKVDNIKNLF